MEKLLNSIKEIIICQHGRFLLKDREVPEDLEDIYKKIYGNLEMETPMDGRNNLRNDVMTIKRDFKKALIDYKATI